MSQLVPHETWKFHVLTSTDKETSSRSLLRTKYVMNMYSAVQNLDRSFLGWGITSLDVQRWGEMRCDENI